MHRNIIFGKTIVLPLAKKKKKNMTIQSRYFDNNMDVPWFKLIIVLKLTIDKMIPSQYEMHSTPWD